MGDLGSGSGSGYPGALDTHNNLEYDSPNANQTKARAAVPNDLAAAIVAIEGALGVAPQGSVATVVAFLQAQHSLLGTHGLSAWADITSTTSASGLTPTVGTLGRTQIYEYTALASALTINAPTGSPQNVQFMEFIFLDNATARALTWNSAFAPSGNVTIPVTTVISTQLRVLFQYSATSNKWVCIAFA